MHWMYIFKNKGEDSNGNEREMTWIKKKKKKAAPSWIEVRFQIVDFVFSVSAIRKKKTHLVKVTNRLRFFFNRNAYFASSFPFLWK